MINLADRGKVAFDIHNNLCVRDIYQSDWSKLFDYEREWWNQIYDACRNANELMDIGGEVMIDA